VISSNHLAGRADNQGHNGGAEYESGSCSSRSVAEWTREAEGGERYGDAELENANGCCRQNIGNDVRLSFHERTNSRSWLATM
jgi:hypothetical protein